jgi:VRR-NUC domain-containing protein
MPTTTRQMTEADLLECVVDCAALFGFRAYHTRFSIGSRDGVGYPDLTLVSSLQRRVIWAELKGPRGGASPEQVEWIAELRLAGQEAYCWWPKDWLDGTIERVLRGEERAS